MRILEISVLVVLTLVNCFLGMPQGMESFYDEGSNFEDIYPIFDNQFVDRLNDLRTILSEERCLFTRF